MSAARAGPAVGAMRLLTDPSQTDPLRTDPLRPAREALTFPFVKGSGEAKCV